MKKLIILFLLITGYSFAQDPFGKGNQTPIGFYTNYIGTATTSSGIATLNKLAGVITTDQLATTTGGPITVDNSYVTTSSIILVTLLTDDSDRTNQPHCTIRSIFSGQFTVDVYRDGASFIREVQIHFLIIN